MILSSDRFVRLLASLLRPGTGSPSEQRRHPRVNIRTSAFFAPYDTQTGVGPAYSVRLLNLSASGVGVQSVTQMELGTQFVIDMPDSHPVDTEIPDDTQRLRVLCKVVHCRTAGSTQFVIGAQFLRLWTAPAPTLDSALAAA
jgi:PilZ domain